MNKIRQIIREELRKMRLDERKKGNDVIMEMSKIVMIQLISDFTKHCIKYKNHFSELESEYQHYLSVKEQEEWIDEEDAFSFDSNFFGIGRAFNHLLRMFNTEVVFSSKELKTNVQLVPLMLKLEAETKNYGGVYYSNERRLRGGFTNKSKIGIAISEKDMRFFTTSTSKTLNMRVSDLIRAQFSTIVHEIQHYYDDMRDGEFSTTRSKGYKNPDEDPKAYYSSPLEISAFFTQVVNELNLRSSPWNEIKFEFFKHYRIKQIMKYNGEGIRRKLLKRLYTLWQDVNHELNFKDKHKDITDKVDKVDKELSVIAPNERRNQIYYNHAQNAIVISTMILPTIEDEIAIHKKLIKLADIYRKDIVLDLAKGWTTSMLGVARKYLKELGYRKNRGSRRNYKYRQGYVRNPKR